MCDGLLQSELIFSVTCQRAAQLGMTSSVFSNGNTTTLCNDTKERTFQLRPTFSASGSALAAQLHNECSYRELQQVSAMK